MPSGRSFRYSAMEWGSTLSSSRSEIVDFMGKVEREFQPTQKEMITLGILTQRESMTSLQLVKELELGQAEHLKPWLGRLKGWGLIIIRGRTKGAEYQVSPLILRRMEFKGATSLKRIQDHRLRELVMQDLVIYAKASRSEIHQRIGPEIEESKLRRVLKELVGDGSLRTEGMRRWRKYLLSTIEGKNHDSAQ